MFVKKISVEIKNFISTVCASPNDIDNLCRELGIDNVYKAVAFTEIVNTMIQYIERTFPEDRVITKLYNAIRKLKPEYEKEINNLFLKQNKEEEIIIDDNEKFAEHKHIPNNKNLEEKYESYDQKIKYKTEIIKRQDSIVNRLFELIKAKEKKLLIEIFKENISYDIGMSIKQQIKKYDLSKREDFFSILREIYEDCKNNKDFSYQFIRQSCCYYMCYLKTPHSDKFLKDVLLSDKSQFVKRGVYMGMILTRNCIKSLKEYMLELKNDEIASSINAGYHQCYYGDKFFKEGLHFTLGINNVSTINALLSHLNNKKYNLIWPIDLHTISYLIYRCSTKILSKTQMENLKNVVSRIKKENHKYTDECVEEANNLNELLTLIKLDEESPPNEYYITKKNYIKKLIEIEKIKTITKNYSDSIYIDGKFYAYKEYFKLNDFKDNIIQDENKFDLLINEITMLLEIKNISTLNILDIGCSYGAFLNQWKKRFNAKVIGLDITPNACQIANQLYPSLEILSCDANHIEKMLNLKKIDIISCFDLLEHFFDIEFFLYKLSLYLKKNTYMIIYMPILPEENISIENLLKFEYLYEEHIYYFTQKGLVNILKKLNLILVNCKEIKANKYLFIFKKK